MARTLFSFGTTRLARSMTSTTQTSGIILEALRDPLDPSQTTSWANTGNQVLRFSGTYQGRTRQELIYVDSLSVDSTTKQITLNASGLLRNVDWKQGSIPAQLSEIGIQWTAGTQVDLVSDHTFQNSLAQKSSTNTFTDDQTIASGKKIKLGTNAYAYTDDDGMNLRLKDGNNTEKTLTQLSAGAGADEKAKVSLTDSTSDFLTNKIAAGTGITKTITNPGGAEGITLSLTSPISATDLPNIPVSKLDSGTNASATTFWRGDGTWADTGLPGIVNAYAGSSAPSGWLLCNGAAVSRTTYSNLFAVISTTYGSGDGSTTFNLPDLRGRVITGVDGGAGRITSNNALSNTGGNIDGAHSHSFAIKQNIFGGASAQAPAQPATDITNNLPPYLVLNYIIKT